MQVLLVILSAVIGYLFGTIPVGACIARLYGNLDI
ncbi:MAG TPA: glycerol-3-phosphate acyltransferase, partial [Candidatus Faecivicinus avistercoris]|nr:glycerol-3-phosphate acyltransferase [Candidatus Faecivicinus avistercoris]